MKAFPKSSSTRFLTSLLVGLAIHSMHALAEAGATLQASPIQSPPQYKWATVDGVKVFYREAGDPGHPTILLLHGFSSSSHMFRDLIPLLADSFHLIAPDYPGFGYSDAPPAARFSPTFERLASFMNRFTESVGLSRYLIYMQDFGGPVGFRMATAKPAIVSGLIIQNANAYMEGLNIKALDRPEIRATDPALRSTVEAMVNAAFIVELYKDGARNPDALSPDAWTVDLANLDRPGAKALQSALINDYVNNLSLYPEWQAYLRDHQPKTLVVWGRNDRAFLPAGAEAFRRDLDNVDIRFYDTGHFALEEDARAISLAIKETFGAPAGSRSD